MVSFNVLSRSSFKITENRQIKSVFYYCLFRTKKRIHVLNTYLCFKVGADPDNTSLDSHLEGEADHPPDF